MAECHEELDERVARIVFGFSDECIDNPDLPLMDYSNNRQLAGKVICKVYSAGKDVRERFDAYLRERYALAKVHDGECEFLLWATPDVVCEAAIHAFT